jgi:glucosamine--fructose-6-phosphate aminotransferase (isomerizing)
MCGIIGYLGTKQAPETLLEGLVRMEYRGYDSAGIVTIEDANFHLIKASGKVSVLSEKMEHSKLRGTTGLGHTRWATHGAPTEKNAHPHVADRIAIVHNGIIENYAELREDLLKKGIQFASETDTEVLAWLIESHYKGDLREAVAAALQEVRGTYALAVIAKDQPEVLVAARLASPLLLGKTDNGWCVASDGAALAGEVDEVLYLEDHDLAVCTLDGYHVYGENGEELERELTPFKMAPEEVKKGGYDHFLMKEIMEQPESLRRTLNTEKEKELITTRRARELDYIMITACGTASYAGMLAKYYLEEWCKLSVSVEVASEFRYRNAILPKNSLGIVISQSGETADTRAALTEFTQRGVPTIAIINAVGSTIAREADAVRYLHVGPEISVASTKAFTSQVVALMQLGLDIAQKRGTLSAEAIAAGHRKLESLPDQIATILAMDHIIKQKAKPIAAYEHVFYLGRNTLFPISLEGAIKLKETSYIHADAYPAGEMKHGPIALIDNNLFTIFLIGKGPLFEKSISNLSEVQARGGKTLLITDEEEYAKEHPEVLYIPTASVITEPLLFNVALQLIAYHVAVYRGCDVDQPRNLAKSVTVE